LELLVHHIFRYEEEDWAVLLQKFCVKETTTPPKDVNGLAVEDQNDFHHQHPQSTKSSSPIDGMSAVSLIDNGDDAYTTAEVDPEKARQRAAAEALKLKKMGLVTAIAIAIHNFPEGLATFIAVLEDESLGVSLTFAIAIHNIPEGICVAMPVYFATNSKWKAMWWATLAGLTEPLGALIGYLVLNNNFSNLAFGIVFGLVGGAMVQICMQELIPQSFKHDPKNEYSTAFIVLGFAVMASSLLLFL